MKLLCDHIYITEEVTPLRETPNISSVGKKYDIKVRDAIEPFQAQFTCYYKNNNRLLTNQNICINEITKGIFFRLFFFLAKVQDTILSNITL